MAEQYNRYPMKLAITRRDFVTGLAALSAETVNFQASSLGMTIGRPTKGIPPRNQLHGAGHRASATGQSADSPMIFENTIDASKIHFVLKNSVSPQRYSIETMTGGVASSTTTMMDSWTSSLRTGQKFRL